MFTSRHLNGYLILIYQRIKRRSFGKFVHPGRHQPNIYQLFQRMFIPGCNRRIHTCQQFIFSNGKIRSRFSAIYLDCFNRKHLQLLVTRQKLPAKRPSGATDHITNHTPFPASIGCKGNHIRPFIRQVRLALIIQAISPIRKSDRIDFNTTDPNFFHQIQFPGNLVFINLQSIPPPSHKRSVLSSRILKSLIQIPFRFRE